MAEYVTKEQVIDWFRPYGHMDDPIPFETMVSDLRSMPDANVAPVRHGPCPYCDAKTNDFITINQTVEYSGIEIALNRQGMLRVRVYESGQETFNAQDIVEIKFCPNCGAKMDGGAD